MNTLDITLAPSGLCNRWRTFLSAIAVGELCERRVRVVWNQAKACNCKLDRLWLPTDRITLISQDTFNKHRGKRFDRDTARNIPDWPGKHAKMVKINHTFGLDIPARPLASWANQFLTPLPALQQRVDSYYDQYLKGQKVVSVVIRRVRPHSDHLKVPITWHFGRMDAIRKEHPDTKFFMVIDHPDVKKKMHQRFDSDTLLEAPKRGYEHGAGYVPPQGLVDVYLMLRSSMHIVSTRTSSLGRMPCLLDPNMYMEVDISKDVPPIRFRETT